MRRGLVVEQSPHGRPFGQQNTAALHGPHVFNSARFKSVSVFQASLLNLEKQDRSLWKALNPVGNGLFSTRQKRSGHFLPSGSLYCVSCTAALIRLPTRIGTITQLYARLLKENPTHSWS